MTVGDSKAATTIKRPALVSSPLSRPAPTSRALPPKPAAQRGQNWKPIRGQIWEPIDSVAPSLPQIGLSNGADDRLSPGPKPLGLSPALEHVEALTLLRFFARALDKLRVSPFNSIVRSKSGSSAPGTAVRRERGL